MGDLVPPASVAADGRMGDEGAGCGKNGQFDREFWAANFRAD
jgi:hypothetical protein